MHQACHTSMEDGTTRSTFGVMAPWINRYDREIASSDFTSNEGELRTLLTSGSEFRDFFDKEDRYVSQDHGCL